MRKKSYLWLAVALTSGCATILSGRTQIVTIESNPPGARCDLTREGRIIGVVNSTPGAITISKTKHDISVSCAKEGYYNTSEFIKSGTEGRVVANIIGGGLIGFIGWGVDSAVGADNRYPDFTTITLAPAGIGTSVQTEQGVVPPRSAPPLSNDTRMVKPVLSSDIQQRLKQLEELRQRKLLTESDYKETRRRILSEL